MPMPAMLPACDALPALVTACPAAAKRPAPQPQRSALGAAAGRLPLHLARLSSVHPATDPNTDTRWDSYQPPLLKCLVGTRHQKIVYTFSSPGKPRHGTPPRSFSPQKIFQTKNSAWVPGGVGLGPWRRRGWGWRTPGRVARLPHAFYLWLPLPWPWRRCDAPQRRRFIIHGGRSWGAFQVAGVPGGRGPILPTEARAR